MEENIEILQNFINEDWNCKYTLTKVKQSMKNILAELELLKDQKQYVIDEYGRTIEEKDRQIKQLTQTNKSYKGIINKKNKIIDEMAKEIGCLIVKTDKKGSFSVLARKEDIKQYIEKKVEEENVKR